MNAKGDRAFLGMSHSPLMGLNPVPEQAEAELLAAIAQVRDRVLAYAPDLVVLIAPDHYNGFFNRLMPPFCIGTQARAVGDYLSPAGQLRVDAPLALEMADALMDRGFDAAVSRRMEVDHGFAQPLQLLWGGLETPPVVPVFVNAVAPPGIPRLFRCRDLGRAIGDFLDGVPRRVLLIGSGGLSHEPPVPTLDHPDPEVRERITVPGAAAPGEREAKLRRVMAAGQALAAGAGTVKPLAPDWDRRWMDALAGPPGSLDELCSWPEDTIAREAGASAHESKTWLVARAALTGRVQAPVFRYYRAIPEYIAGFGLMLMTQQGRTG